MRETDLLIVGAGAAGLSAAQEAAKHGLSVTVLDDNLLPGGQYFRRLPTGYRHTQDTVFDKERQRADALYSTTGQKGVTYLNDAVVWESPENGVLAFARGADSGRIRAKLTIIASGAHDRPAPFPGWTLPGVVTAGGLQNLLKGQRVIPGRRAVVAGNGPLVLLVGATLARAGAELREVVEAAPILKRLAGSIADLVAMPKIVRQAIDYRLAILKSGAKLRTGWTVIEARGADELEEVVLAPIDAAGKVDRSRTRSVKADLLVVGFGLMPSIELVRLLDCKLEWKPLRGGWVPVRGTDFETSRPGVLAVGDGAGIGGVEMALREGKLAGVIAAERLGKLSRDQAANLKAPIQAEIAKVETFRRGLERLYAMPPAFLDLLTPETIVCRCEDVTAGELRARQDAGFGSTAALKGTTRTTMGRCQGRNCLRTLSAIIAQQSGQPIDQVMMPRPRLPARLVTIGDLLQEELPPIEMPKDPHLPRGERVS